MKDHARMWSRPVRAGMAFCACVALIGLTAQTRTAAAETIPEIKVEGESEVERDYDRPDGFRRTVRFADIDLAAPDGIRQLTRRVRDAATDGCNKLYRGDPPVQSMHLRVFCVRTSVREAMPQVERVTRMAMNGELSSTQVAVTMRR